MSIENKVKQWLRSDILAQSAYQVMPTDNILCKLDAMENPYTWPAPMKQSWFDGLANQEVNRYPDPQALELKQRLRQVMKISDDLDLVLGNGSDELIQMLALAVAQPEKSVKILAPEPTFVMYQMISQHAYCDYIGVPLNADFNLDTPKMLAAIKQHRPAIIFLSYPNNPTGNLFKQKDIFAIIKASDGLVVIDEAYAPFTNKSFLPKLSQWDNVLIMRTISKMGLAGLRLGLLVGDSAWISQIDKLRLPYNISSLTQYTADFALQYQHIFYHQAEQICQDRDVMLNELKTLGLKVYPSQANFILFESPDGEAKRLFLGLQKAGILIKNLEPKIKNGLRVTIGTQTENQQFLRKLGKLL